MALPPKFDSISENQVDNPTPRTSRSHLLAGLRTQPKTPAVPASAPYDHAQYQQQGFGASQWASQGYNAYNHGIPQTATGMGYNMNNQYAPSAGRQTYSLGEQVLAPPSLYDQSEEMDPAVLQQMQMTRLYLAQRQQQLEQQLADLTASAQGMSLNTNPQRQGFQQLSMSPPTPQNMCGQQSMQSPIEVPGQPGVYLVWNPAIQSYSYAYDQSAHQRSNNPSTNQSSYFNGPSSYQSLTPSVSVTPPAIDRPGANRTRSYTPPKLAPAHVEADHVEPLPPPSSNAFRRGHKKAQSLVVNPHAGAFPNGPKTASTATFGSQRSALPQPPMTGTFGPGAARAGDHPIRQPRGPPPLEELVAQPTGNLEGSKNFAARQRRRALDSLVRAGTSRRGVSRSSTGSPVSERGYGLSLSEEGEDDTPLSSTMLARKMSPIGTEMKEKRGSQGSSDGYFGLSSASSSEGEDTFKLPPTPASPIAGGGDRKSMMLGVLNAAEKRRSFAA